MTRRLGLPCIEGDACLGVGYGEQLCELDLVADTPGVERVQPSQERQRRDLRSACTEEESGVVGGEGQGRHTAMASAGAL